MKPACFLVLVPRRVPVIKAAQQAWQGEYADLAPRAQLVAGSFFEAAPPADVSWLLARAVVHATAPFEVAHLLHYAIHSCSSFLPPLPRTAAQAYFLKSILHDWSDEQSSRILRAIRRSATADARLLLCEVAVPDDLAQVGGRMQCGGLAVVVESAAA